MLTLRPHFAFVAPRTVAPHTDVTSLHHAARLGRAMVLLASVVASSLHLSAEVPKGELFSKYPIISEGVHWTNYGDPAYHFFARNNEAEDAPGYRVVVKVVFDAQDRPGVPSLVFSDDCSGEKVLEALALEKAKSFTGVSTATALKTAPGQFLLPFYFRCEEDEGVDANRAPKPRLLEGPMPEMPSGASCPNENGGAILEFKIGSAGELLKVTTLTSSHKAYADAALSAAKRWKFAPALSDGKPVKSRWRIAVAFRVNNEELPWKWRIAPRPFLGAFIVNKPALLPATGPQVSSAQATLTDLGIIVVESLTKKGDAVTQAERFKIAFEKLARAHRWPTRFTTESMASQRRSFPIELKIVNQPLGESPQGDLSYRGWVTLDQAGKHYDFGMVSCTVKALPGDDDESRLLRLYDAAASAAALKFEPVLFPGTETSK